MGKEFMDAGPKIKWYQQKHAKYNHNWAIATLGGLQIGKKKAQSLPQ